MTKKTKTAYTHPELAEYLKNLIARHRETDGRRLLYIIREEAGKTVDELIAHEELIDINGSIDLPAPIKNKLLAEKHKKYLKFLKKRRKKLKNGRTG